MNSVMERWIGSCRRELLDRTLVWNHLMIVLREYVDFCYNTHRTKPCSRPHRSARYPTASPAWTSSGSSGVRVA
jgi:hypothetical protein